jgi:hypothetical protein
MGKLSPICGEAPKRLKVHEISIAKESLAFP